MPAGIQQPTKIETPPTGFLGMDTASEPTSIDLARSRRLYNAWQGKLKALTKRPGSVPVHTPSVGAPIKHVAQYKGSTTAQPDLLAAAGTTLYKLSGTTLTGQTMTNPLVSSDVYTEDFTDATLTSRLIIADGGSLKAYNGTAVANITPAPNDTAPAPANVLTNINTKGNKFCWVYSGHIFLSPGTNEMFYLKRYRFDYAPEVQYFYLVRDNDYVNGCGIAFNNVCLVPMRRGWAMLTGDNFNNFDASQFLNTVNGVIAPRTIARVTYATGAQTIVYLSDDGLHEIIDTGAIDSGVRQYATRGLMKETIDWGAFGFTDTEMSQAIGQYIVRWNMYLLEINSGVTPYVFGFDTRNGEWYMWTGLTINSLIEFGGVVYFGGDDGLLKKFDPTLTDDWTTMAKTAGTNTPVDLDRISGMISFENTGYPSTLDNYILRLKQYAVKSSLDISIIHMRGIEAIEQALKNGLLVWDVAGWDEAVWANTEYSDLVAAPQRLANRLKLPKQAHFLQVRWRNNRSEPVEIYGETFIARVSGEL